MRCVCAVCVSARESENEREEACEQEGKIKKERKSGRTQMQYLSAYNGEKYRLTSLLYILLFRMHCKKGTSFSTAQLKARPESVPQSLQKW